MLFFYRSIVIQLFLNAYFVFRIWKSNYLPRILKWLFTIIYGLEAALYFVGLIAGERLPVETYAFIQRISGVWTIGNLYLFLLLSLFDLFNYYDKKKKLSTRLGEGKVRRIKTVCFLILTLFIGAQLYFGYENFRHPIVRTYPFDFNKREGDSTRPKTTYKLLVASDIHLGYIIDKEKLKEYVRFINEQNADIVVIDGDLIDYTLRPLIEGKMNEDLRRIKAPKGVYFIMGNHDYKHDPEANMNWLKQCGMIILKDSVVTIDNQLCLIGRDDYSNQKKRMPIEELMSHADLSKPCIFLAHQPRDIKDAYEYHVPLTICGHTHAGQTFPMNLLGHLLYSYTYGLAHQDNCFNYVTSGLGLSGFPLRVGTHSEVVVFNVTIY